MRDRERQTVSRGGAERDGDRESEAGPRLRTVSSEPDTGLEPTNREIMTPAEVGRSTDGATQVPPFGVLFTCGSLHSNDGHLLALGADSFYFTLWVEIH